MRHIPDAVIYFTGFITTIFFLFCSIYFMINRTIGQLTLFFGIAFGLFTGFLYWQNDTWKDRREEKPAKPYTYTEEKKLPDRKIKHLSPLISRPTVTKKEEPTTTLQSQQTASIFAPNSNIFIGPNSGYVTQSVNIDEFPKPKVEFKAIKINSPESGTYKSEILLHIESKTVLKKLTIIVKSSSIVTLLISPIGGGVMLVQGNSGHDMPYTNLQGMAYYKIANASGDYLIQIATRSPDKIDLLYNED